MAGSTRNIFALWLVLLVQGNCAVDLSSTIYQFIAPNSEGQDVSFSKYKGKVLLIVNVASYCGFTNSNYHQLKILYDKYHSRGLEIAAFPCNQFGKQEPDDVQTVKEFVKHAFDFEPDIYEKVEVNGGKEHPIFTYLKTQRHGTLTDHIKWNFTKFLINKHGYVVKRYAPTVEPLDMEKDIMELLSDRAEL